MQPKILTSFQKPVLLTACYKSDSYPRRGATSLHHVGLHNEPTHITRKQKKKQKSATLTQKKTELRQSKDFHLTTPNVETTGTKISGFLCRISATLWEEGRGLKLQWFLNQHQMQFASSPSATDMKDWDTHDIRVMQALFILPAPEE